MKTSFGVESLAQFKSLEEEVAFLRNEIAERDKHFKENLRHRAEPLERHREAARAVTEEYQRVPAAKALEPERILQKDAVEAIVLNLPPEAHDEVIGELLGIMQKEGIKNALTVMERIGNPHVADDFHRFLAEYIFEGYEIPGLSPKESEWLPLHMVLYEVTFPAPRGGEKDNIKRSMKELMSSMEQWYLGMLSFSKSSNEYFAIEIAVPEGTEEIAFYVAVPSHHKSVFEKQFGSFFPDASFKEQHADYNIFVEGGESFGAYASLQKESILPLRLTAQFDTDPLPGLLNAFSKIEKSGAGAAIQIVITPATRDLNYKYEKVLERLRRGEYFHKAFKEEMRGAVGKIAFEVAKSLGEYFLQNDRERDVKKEDFDNRHQKNINEKVIEIIKHKLESPLTVVGARAIVSAGTSSRAKELLADITAPFGQFTNGEGNAIVWHEEHNAQKKQFFKRFAFREAPISTESMSISLNELVPMMHFPTKETTMPASLKKTRGAVAEAGPLTSSEGILLGVNEHQGTSRPVHFAPEDRLRHFYVIGQTGTGKTSILKNMIIQDIENGEGVCFIDPHGADVEDILAAVPPERAGDVIYFDPGNLSRVYGLNMLEYDPTYPEQKTFVVNELLGIFKKLYGSVPESMGPAFEQYFRNATMLVMEDPKSGATMLDIGRVLSNAQFRELKLSKSTNLVVNQFWREIATKAGGEASLANIVPYITNKFDVFTTNDIMRPIIAQEKSTLNMRKIMDERKILLANLSKGKLGDLNANFIGLILVGKFLMAALSRTSGIKNLPPFYLYIDEFQNVTTDSIATILSEARKYKLSLIIAHQFIKQLEEKIKDAVFGNVGSMAAFRVGAEDAEFLEKQYNPPFTKNDLMRIDNYEAYVRMLAAGKPLPPFRLRTNAPKKTDPANAEMLKELSYKTYGRPREEVEAEIAWRFGVQK